MMVIYFVFVLGIGFALKRSFRLSLLPPNKNCLPAFARPTRKEGDRYAYLEELSFIVAHSDVVCSANDVRRVTSSVTADFGQHARLRAVGDGHDLRRCHRP